MDRIGRSLPRSEGIARAVRVMRDRLRHRPMLSAALVAGATAGPLAGLHLSPSTAVLVGWCMAAVVYIAVTQRTLARATPEALRRRAALLEEGKWAVLAACVAAAVASLGAVVVDLAAARGSPAATGSAALAAVTLLLSWAFVHVLFAGHYAHEYWLAGGGLIFPGGERPDHAEFLYLAFAVGMTCQVSDVTTASAPMRRLVLLHALVAFGFNAVILAAAVNLAAGLVG
jgi:uncharacterized membrane protein